MSAVTIPIRRRLRPVGLEEARRVLRGRRLPSTGWRRVGRNHVGHDGLGILVTLIVAAVLGGGAAGALAWKKKEDTRERRRKRKEEAATQAALATNIAKARKRVQDATEDLGALLARLEDAAAESPTDRMLALVDTAQEIAAEAGDITAALEEVGPAGLVPADIEAAGARVEAIVADVRLLLFEAIDQKNATAKAAAKATRAPAPRVSDADASPELRRMRALDRREQLLAEARERLRARAAGEDAPAPAVAAAPAPAADEVAPEPQEEPRAKPTFIDKVKGFFSGGGFGGLEEVDMRRSVRGWVSAPGVVTLSGLGDPGMDETVASGDGEVDPALLGWLEGVRARNRSRFGMAGGDDLGAGPGDALARVTRSFGRGEMPTTEVELAPETLGALGFLGAAALALVGATAFSTLSHLRRRR